MFQGVQNFWYDDVEKLRYIYMYSGVQKNWEGSVQKFMYASVKKISYE